MEEVQRQESKQGDPAERRSAPPCAGAEEPAPGGPVADASPPDGGHAKPKPPTHEEEMPRVVFTRREAVALGMFVLTVVAFLYFVLPKLAGVGATLHRLENGNGWWIAAAVALELASFAGYVVLFRAVFVLAGTRRPLTPGPAGSPHTDDSPDAIASPDPSAARSPIGWRESYQITMAGLAATRLFAAAGAGGIALTAWALRRSGMEPRLVASRMFAFMVLLYGVYAGSVLLDGIGLGTGLLPGGGSPALTILPAIVAGILIAAVGAMALLPGDIERRLGRLASGSRRLTRWVALAATVPALAAGGVRTAIALIRENDAGLFGAIAWWAFDIGVLWAMFHAFGSPPPFAVIWMAYFIGMLGNLLPLPGGLGGVEGGMIGALVAFGVDFNLAVLAVLSYRGVSFWLPTVPGAIAYFQLRRTVARWRSEQSARQTASKRPGGGMAAAGTGRLYFTK
jgi:uncharacterized membrane protein YbhN (UPF0104 family)